MTMGSKLAEELPYLRRYARAVTGSQALGDAAVRAMLEAILESPDEFDATLPARLAIYRIFHRSWRSIDEATAEKRPTALLDPQERYALMLTALEDFTVAESASILGVTPQQVERDLAMARRMLAESLTSRLIIIEDEPMIALHVKAVVEEFGHVVAGIARTRSEAIALARRTAPELVLADINLADGSSGIDAVQDIVQDHEVPVVFVTSFPERLLTGERPEPTYLITKPFDEQTLIATIGQALMFHRERGDGSPVVESGLQRGERVPDT